jgi:biotin carboxyl carrier protein
MKMENSFPRDGVIAISVLMGDAVDKGQLLIELSRDKR